MESKSGKDIIVIELSRSRAKPHQNGKVYLNLDAVERGDNYGNTHFIVEPVSKAERESGVKLPILGNGKEWGDGAEVKKRVQEPVSRAQREAESEPSSWKDDQGDDDIPFN